MTTFWNLQKYEQHIAEAAALLRDGQTVAFPTETVYGLGGDATKTMAVQRIFAAKGRPSDNPLIVHIADRSQLSGLVQPYDETITKLMDAFWPGPMTIVLPVIAGSISPLVTAGLSTVGVRIPDHPIALDLLRAAGCPVAAPSANSSGKPSPTAAYHVSGDLDGKIDGLLDGGPTGVGLESTVLQYKDDAIYILRPGGVTVEMLKQVLPNMVIHASRQEEYHGAETPASPGMKYTHYAPCGRMQIVQGTSTQAVASRIRAELEWAKQHGERTGVLTYAEHASFYDADVVIPCGSLTELESVAYGLYAALRRFDEAKVTYILAEACPLEGIGAAIMNRLSKAAGYQFIHV